MSHIRLEFLSGATRRQLVWHADSVVLAADGILEVRYGNTLTLLGPGDRDGPVRIVAVNG